MSTHKRAGMEPLVDGLLALGFRKRAGLVFTMPMAGDEVIGWLGLNTATRREKGATTLNPVVGVRHQAVERMVAQLRGDRFHPYVPPTISRPLRYLLNVERRVDWTLHEGPSNASVVDDVIDAVDTVGLAYMRSCEGLPAIISALRAGDGIGPQNAYRLPTALLLDDRAAEAAAALDHDLDGLGSRSDPAATDLRAFGLRFREIVDGCSRG